VACLYFLGFTAALYRPNPADNTLPPNERISISHEG
jgi:hypothetical protein